MNKPITTSTLGLAGPGGHRAGRLAGADGVR